MTSMDRVDYFIYIVYLVPEEFQRNTRKGGSVGEGLVALGLSRTMGGTNRMGPRPTRCGAQPPEIFLYLNYISDFLESLFK